MVMDKKQSFVKLDPILNEVHVRKIRIDETEKAEAVKLCDQVSFNYSLNYFIISQL